MQGFTLKMTGHLFDTKVFNTAIDSCEKEGIIFRVVSWELGCNAETGTEIILQGMSISEEALDKAKAQIIESCKQSNCGWSEV